MAICDPHIPQCELKYQHTCKHYCSRNIQQTIFISLFYLFTSQILLPTPGPPSQSSSPHPLSPMPLRECYTPLLHLSPPLDWEEPCTRLHRPRPPLEGRVDWQACQCQVQNLLLLAMDSMVGLVSQKGVVLKCGDMCQARLLQV